MFKAAFEAVDLPALVEDLTSVFRAAFEKAGIDLVVSTTPLEHDVYVDTDMWEKVWNRRKRREGRRKKPANEKY